MTLRERKIWIAQCLAFFYSTMGAVIDNSRVLWWPVIQVSRILHQVASRRPVNILAGFMSRHRGLHRNLSGADG